MSFFDGSQNHLYSNLDLFIFQLTVCFASLCHTPILSFLHISVEGCQVKEKKQAMAYIAKEAASQTSPN